MMSLPRTVRRSMFFHTPSAFCVIVVIFILFVTNLIFTVYEKVKACDHEPYLTKETMDGIVLRNQVLQLDLSECQAAQRNELVAITKHLREDISQLTRKFNAREAQSVGAVPQQAKPSLAARNESVLVGNMKMHRKLFNYMANNLIDTPYPGVETYTQYATARLSLLPLTGVDSLIPNFGPVINDVLSFQYPLTIASCTEKPVSRSVFIAVVSACANFEKRNTIRQTWKKHLDVVQQKSLLEISGFAFILGQPQNKAMQQQIRQESQIHGDIIQIGMADYYKNLPLKDAGLLNWLNRNCATIDFLAKVDDDVYVNMHNLAYFVQSYYLSRYSVFGVGKPEVGWPNREGKWAMSFEEWPWIHYPPYILGAVVLMSADAILPLLAACQTTPMIPYEDIYLYGMCAQKAGIEIRYSASPNSALIGSVTVSPTTCQLRTMIAWRQDHMDATVVQETMESSHQAVDNFYRNTSQCFDQSNNVSVTSDLADGAGPIHFTFN